MKKLSIEGELTGPVMGHLTVVNVEIHHDGILLKQGKDSIVLDETQIKKLLIELNKEFTV